MPYKADFELFWKAYPRKVGKFAAEKAYVKARRAGAHHVQLMAGIAAYIQHKPGYQDYCHASTWLNEGRWLDEWTEADLRVISPMSSWVDECKELHAGECGLDRWRHYLRKQIEEQKKAAS